MTDSRHPSPIESPDISGAEVSSWVAATGPTAADSDRVIQRDDSLIGVSFNNIMMAQEFLLAMNRLSAGSDIVLRDAVVVVKDDHGHVRVRETLDPQPGGSALSGAMWSGLLGLLIGGPVGWLAGVAIGAATGAIVARVVDIGIPDDWVAWFKAAVQPHTATVVVLAGSIDVIALQTEALRFAGGSLVHTTLGPGVEAMLAEAFDNLDTTPGTR